MQERRKEKQDYPQYLDILPKGLGDFPIFFTEEERAFLKGSPFLQQVYEKIEDIKIDYDLITKEVPEFGELFTLKEYSEVRMMVSSRIFGITVHGVKTDGFVPYADMLNHRRPRQTTWYYSDEREGFIIEACDDIVRGDQVYDSYGQKCNSRFFLNYGFINQPNDANEVPIIVTLDKEKDQVAYDIKMQLISKTKDFQKFRVVENLEEKVMKEFISWLRYAEFDGDMAQLYLYKNEALIEAQKKKQNKNNDSDESEDDVENCFNGTSLKFVSVDNEIKVWKKIQELCNQGLSKYATTLQEDTDMLAKDDNE